MNPALIFGWLPLMAYGRGGMDPSGYVIIVGGSLAAMFGFIAGLSARWLPKAPILATGALVIAYVLLIVVAIGWTASCSSCDSTLMGGDEARGGDIFFTAVWGVFVGVPIFGIIWLGALLSRLLPGHRRERM